MPYPLQQLQKTAQHIVKLLRFQSGKTLAQSDKKWAERELLVVLDALSHQHTKAIFIDPSNPSLAHYFRQLEDDGMVFPDNHKILLKDSGESFDKTIISRLNFAEQADLVAHHIAERCESVKGHPLNDFQHNFVVDAVVAYLMQQSFKPSGGIALSHRNRACHDLIDELFSQGVVFPQVCSFIMKPHGECTVKMRGQEEVIYKPEVQRTLIYSHHQKKGRNQRMALPEDELIERLKHFLIEDGPQQNNQLTPALATMLHRYGLDEDDQRQLLKPDKQAMSLNPRL